MSWKPSTPSGQNHQPLAASLNKDSARPSWLAEADREAGQSSSGSGEGSSNGSAEGIEGNSAPLDEEIPRMILYTRVINLILSICMIMVSFLSLVTTLDATRGVLACYVILLSCLLCCYETHLKQVSKLIALNFGFLYSAKSRVVFLVFLGTILFSLSLFAQIIGLAMLANAGFNGYIIYKYPEFENAQRTDAQAEIQDFLAKNPAYAASAVSLGVQAAASNPQIVQQAVGFGQQSPRPSQIQQHEESVDL
jgi:hypothetical protein